MALTLLGVALWVVFGLAGAWLLVTGSDTFLWLPVRLNDVRFRRLYGLACMLAAGFFVFQFSRGSFDPVSAAGLCAGLGVATLTDWWMAREARAGRG